ncbi:MAG: hypothetical protein ACOH2P_09585 [Pseudomonas sp.]
MHDLPKEVAVLFENNSEFNKVLPNPLLVNDSEFLTALTQQLNNDLGSNRPDDLYRITFKKGSSRELINIQSGELAGLLTTICVEKGKISDVSKLTKISIPVSGALLSSLLTVTIFRSLRCELSYISHTTKVKSHQLQADQARFERITEVIGDSFECVPLVSVEGVLRDIHLARIIRSNDDCYELYISQRVSFLNLLASWPGGYAVFYENSQHYDPARLDIKDFLDRQIIQHPVFAVFERLVAGRVCEVLLSGNYSQLNIQRHRRLIRKVIDELRNCLKDVFRTLRNGAEQLESTMNNRDLTVRERDEKSTSLNQHNAGVELLNSRLFAELDQKIRSLDLLDRIATKQKLDLYLINGALLINDDHVE